MPEAQVDAGLRAWTLQAAARAAALFYACRHEVRLTSRARLWVILLLCLGLVILHIYL